jgi:hypothetical protein
MNDWILSKNISFVGIFDAKTITKQLQMIIGIIIGT